MTDRDEELAHEFGGKANDAELLNDGAAPDIEIAKIVLPYLRQARREGELAMRERAAKVSETCGDMGHDHGICDSAAREIRALEPETPEAK